MTRDLTTALLYFLLSTLFTWWFVVLSPLYISQEQMLLSTSIAGGKWAIQIVCAYLFLGEKRWVFIRAIGAVCLIGSCILLPYPLLRTMGMAAAPSWFIGSLIVAVLVMIYFYFRAVKSTGVPLVWWYGWLGCLAVAVTLQLTVVFHVVEM